MKRTRSARVTLILMAVLALAVVAGITYFGGTKVMAGESGSSDAGQATALDDRIHPTPLPCVVCHGTEEPTEAPEREACVDCHGSLEDVAVETVDAYPNPHDSHMGPMPCSDCHKAHEESTVSCNSCHAFDLTMPENER